LLAALAVVTALAAAEALYILRSGAGPEADAVAAAAPEVPPTALGTLEVSSTPSGALVQIDGRDAGVTPITLADLTPGPHRIVLTAKGRRPVAQQVTIEAGATLKVVAPLLRVASAPPARPAPPPAPTRGTLAIVSPLDMEIREDGALLGRTTGEPPALSPGDHTLHLTDPTTGYAVVQRVRITAGRTTRLTVTPPKRPVNINALPWARVTVDGEAVGETPIGALSLSLGSHVLVFRNPTLGERTITATVTADGPNLFSVDLRK
jgi:serine/threonine-protein kinase